MPAYIRQLWKKQPRSCTLLLAFAVVTGLLTPVITQYEKEIIDALQAVLNAQSGVTAAVRPVVVLLVCYAVLYVLPAASGLLYERVRASGEHLLCTQYLHKLQRLEYRFLEDQQTMNLVSRVVKQCDAISKVFLRNMFELAGALVSVLGFFLLICQSSWISGLVFLVLFVLLLVLADRAAKNFYALNQHFSETERRVMYLDTVVNGRPCAHEKKLFGFTRYIGQKRSAYLLGQRKAMRRYDRKYGITFSLIDTAGYLCTVLMMLSMLPAVQNGTLSVGVFIAASHAAMNLNLTTQNKLRSNINMLMEHRRFWVEYRQFMELPEQTQAAGPAAQTAAAPVELDTIEFRDVGFRYQEDGPWVLRHLDLRMEKGKHYALVGENGCGKSTIIKLLLRLYDVQEGVILINGQDIRSFSGEALCRLYSAVFQDFSRYYVSLLDNVVFGKAQDPARLQAALEMAQAGSIAEKVGPDALLGDIYEEGRDLSGGEWQRVAFARALYHGGAVLLLDEPTAALDPISENEIYTQFGRISAHKTTLFVTHRLASTQMADVIFVLQGGKLAEQGPHEALMQLDGLYAKMYSSQRKWYVGGAQDELNA